MSDSRFIVAIALLDQQGKRLMPLTGKSTPKYQDYDEMISQTGKELVSQLLTRVLELTDELPIKRAGSTKSLILVDIDMLVMNEHLAVEKSKWLNTQDTITFLSSMFNISNRLWTISFEKGSGIIFNISIFKNKQCGQY